MSLTFDQQYADLLDRLSQVDRRAVVQSFGNAMLEGWEPTRADVELLVCQTAGELSTAEYVEQVRANARRRRVARTASSRARGNRVVRAS